MTNEEFCSTLRTAAEANSENIPLSMLLTMAAQRIEWQAEVIEEQRKANGL